MVIYPLWKVQEEHNKDAYFIMNIKELYNIMPIANIPSVMKYGILSNSLRKKRGIINHSIAMQVIQKRREKKVVPRGRPLHDYANLYFNAHNAMLSAVRSHNNNICVLCISPDLLNLPGVVITDQNASSDYAGFYSYPDGLTRLNFDMINAGSWKHPENQILEWQHKSIKCAEVLVPDCVEPRYIIGAYVYNQATSQKLQQKGFSGNIKIKGSLFF
jgi:hypothetical protein